MPGRTAQAISPTAHYTAAVWAANGLGASTLATPVGSALHALVSTVTTPSRLLGGPTLDAFLLARHRIIDRLLERAIGSGEVTQVVELAAGLSPRGLSFTHAHPGLTYVEVDLPRMAEHKRSALLRSGPLAPGHRIEAADVFAPDALDRIADGLDRDRGLAVITEGLINYFPTDDVELLWSRVATMAGSFAHGCYLSDIHLGSASGTPVLERAFVAVLSAFVRGRVHLHFTSPEGALAALRAAGFAHATLHAARDHADLPGMGARGSDLVRVIEAVTSTG